MNSLPPIPSGPELERQREMSEPDGLPVLPNAWSASVLLTPFGDSIAPITNSSQLAVARIEVSSIGAMSWMRVKLYLTQDLLAFDFLFSSVDGPGSSFRSEWFWIDSSLQPPQIYGPFKTTLRVPGPQFLEDNHAQWGNRYPLMCTDTNPLGIECDHWVIPTPGLFDHGSWYTFRKDTGNLFRIHTMDTCNPMMIPILGSYFIANLPSVQPGISEDTDQLVGRLIAGSTIERPGYWNPLITQEEIQHAVASPISVAACTLEEIQGIIPGFSPASPGTPLPEWSHNTYIEGWCLAQDLFPYSVRVFYQWTGDEQSRHQAIFIGEGSVPGSGNYLQRHDTCLSASQTDLPFYNWDRGTNSWQPAPGDPPLPGLGLPKPDWLARSGASIMGQIRGNPNFALQPDEVLNLIAAESRLGGGELTIFWVWFLANGVSTLFSEAKYMNSLSHRLQLLDYTVFMRNAPVTPANFENPFGGTAQPERSGKYIRKHLGKFHGARAGNPHSRK